MLPPKARMRGRIGGAGARYSHVSAGDTDKKRKTPEHDLSGAVFVDDRRKYKLPSIHQKLMEVLERVVVQTGGSGSVQEGIEAKLDKYIHQSLTLTKTKNECMKILKAASTCGDDDDIEDAKTALSDIKEQITEHKAKMADVRRQLQEEKERLAEREKKVHRVLGTPDQDVGTEVETQGTETGDIHNGAVDMQQGDEDEGEGSDEDMDSGSQSSRRGFV